SQLRRKRKELMPFDPPLALVCFEVRRKMVGGRTKPLLAACIDESDRESLVVLKLRNPETRYRDGHFGATSLAVELVCSVIARICGIDVPDYAIVDLPAEVATAHPSADMRRLHQQNVGPNFGTIYHESFMLWNAEDVARSTTVLDAIEDVMSFDAATYN